MAEHPLIAAVRAGDGRGVEALLSEGADPEAVDGGGTPVLCLAVDALDEAIVEQLVWRAQVDRPAPDGRTPLLRAVEQGALGIVTTLMHHGADPRRKDAEGRDALELARYWHSAGVEAELRRRAGTSEPIRRRRVVHESGTVCAELSLGGLTVRDGHTAILTELERRYGIVTPFAELLDRASAERDTEHEVWLTTADAVRERHDRADWDAAGALRDSANPLARYFGAEVLCLIVVHDDGEDESFDEPIVDILLPWVAREEDPLVLRTLTLALGNASDPRARRPLPALARNHDAGVRRWAVKGLYGPVSDGDTEALAAVLACTGDVDAEVRESACWALGEAPAGSPASDALAACLGDEDEAVRVVAATRLGLRDDPRGDEVLRALGDVGQDSPYYWHLDSLRRHRRAQGRDG
ncbi:HEAT repeat domain-containing protein [Streptomyces sp. I05A-00742]|uniref:HEAT repeat domain-containing protein n=1 Tax=Streptomyces sp. I05A-00742 TaxID=2732853 RepID=UPI0014878E55|nr:HEAT repeat domain-containing protein [Streptomyces sp. I05A-00742]